MSRLFASFCLRVLCELEQRRSSLRSELGVYGLHRLSSVIAPKLAREQTMLHIDVKSSLIKSKSQGLLCFQERDAA
jgi:hypothetical protein